MTDLRGRSYNSIYKVIQLKLEIGEVPAFYLWLKMRIKTKNCRLLVVEKAFTHSRTLFLQNRACHVTVSTALDGVKCHLIVSSSSSPFINLRPFLKSYPPFCLFLSCNINPVAFLLVQFLDFSLPFTSGIICSPRSVWTIKNTST